MLRKSQWISLLSVAGLSVLSSVAQADRTYEVTITNLTKAQAFTPILVTTHTTGTHIFQVGEAASDDLAALAEGGDVAPLVGSLGDNSQVHDTQHSTGLLMPGATVTVTVTGRGPAKRISLASMLIPTNDSFIGLDGVRAPNKGSVSFTVPGYDAGTETNDELCVNIPGPVCGGEGGSPESDGEGFVRVSEGISGIGDLASATYDWHNPTAKVTITRVMGDEVDVQ